MAGRLAGPGRQAAGSAKDGSPWMAYHAWDIARASDQVDGTRSTWIDQLEITT